MGNSEPFYRIVREERLFCATLAALLIQKGSNLQRFAEMVNQNLGEEALPESQLADAEIYLEYTYLRDHWDSLSDKDKTASNQRKLDVLTHYLDDAKLLSSVPEEQLLEAREAGGVREFNHAFMGAGPRIPEDDVVYPGRWTVGALSERFKDNATFVRFCKFKWSFNIKPDMVIVSQGTPLLCVEAKLKSGEGTYPASNSERGIFGDRELDPVRQLEVQQFMFEDILQQPFHSFVIHDGTLGPAKGMRWTDVFGKLDTSASIPSVNLLLTENRHLKREGWPS